MQLQLKKIINRWVRGQRFDLGHGGERQIATNLLGIRSDHKSRYHFASKTLSGNCLLDAASGIGYGAYILARDNKERKIWAVDKDESAHYFGKTYFDHRNVLRIPLYLEDISRLEKVFDGCSCFETLEHLEHPKVFLEQLRKLIKPGGKLIASCPNELMMPYSQEKFRYHIKHFTPSEFDELFKSAGWSVVSRHSQHDKYSVSVDKNINGAFLIWECEA